MNQSDFDVVVNSTVLNIKSLLTIKGGEYAGNEDRLANFKRGAVLTGCTPLQVVFIYLSKHYDGVASFIKSSAAGTQRPSSEPIEGRLDDLINYCILAKALLAESKNESHRDDLLDRGRLSSGASDSTNRFPPVQPSSDSPYAVKVDRNFHNR